MVQSSPKLEMPAADAVLPLYRHFPEIERYAPRVVLCALPTPVQRFALLPKDSGELYVKRDDLTAVPYGGNKVRKLEFLLAQARLRGAREVVTFGYVGSNHALATAIYSGRAGLRATSILLPQPNAHYVRRNLLAGHAAGARLIARSSVRSIAATVAMKTTVSMLLGRGRPYIIPAGGSSPFGVLGYVNAAFELTDQIAAGELPAPERVYISFGSMGTTAGLAIGFALAGLQPELHAVRVVDTHFASRQKLERLVHATIDQLSRWVPEMPRVAPLERVVVRDEFFGRRYGEFTESSVAAVRQAHDTSGLRLDGTYSGKALAALTADAQRGELRGRTTLFWNTHNSCDVDALGAGVSYLELPRAFHRYFEEPVQALDPGA